MTCKHLCISVTFLQPTFHGRFGKEDRARNEWPPSPLRLFQAMVAGAAARFGVESASATDKPKRTRLTAEGPCAALEWLAKISAAAPPIIFTPRHKVGKGVPAYVPNNSADLVAAKWAKGDSLATFDERTRKVVRPTHLIGGNTVHFVWTLPAADERGESCNAHVTVLTAVARSIVALGWGIDSAIGDLSVIEESVTQNFVRDGLQRWAPVQGRRGGDGPTLRLPTLGTLDELIRRHDAAVDRLEGGVFRPVPPMQMFGQAAYASEEGLSDRPFASFLLRPVIDPAIAELETPEGTVERRKEEQFRAFGGVNAAKVAAMVRHVACRAAQEGGGWPFAEVDSARYVAGHGVGGGRRKRDDDSARFSYLALPSIGSSHADGMIRRVIVAEPFGGSGEFAAWAGRTLAGRHLVSEETAESVATLTRVDWSDGLERKMFDRFTGASCCWRTETPIVLPGFDGLKMEKAARLFSRACDQAGLPAGCVEEFEFIGPPARGDGRFFVPSYLRGLPLRWAVVRFKHEVRGPIALGAGRHCGLGILAASSESAPRA